MNGRATKCVKVRAPGAAKDTIAEPGRRSAGSPAFNGGDHMRSMLLWFIGLPIPIILIIALFSGHL